MRQLFFQAGGVAALAGVLLGSSLAACPAAAQAPAAALAYTGPRYPGGPDSLRNALRRAVRLAGTVPAGQVFVKLILDDAGSVRKATLLPPPAGSDAARLTRLPEVQAVAAQLRQQLAAWQPGQPAPYPVSPAFVVVPLTFGEAAPLSYSDENPVFRLPVASTGGYAGFPYNLKAFVQRQARYPANDLRNQVQGTVYAYIEVAESGAVAQRRIAGSVSPTLDAEVLRVLQTVPDAQAPPRQQGRPVRVGYVVPIDFRIQ